MISFVFGLISLVVFFGGPNFVSIYAASSNKTPKLGGRVHMLVLLASVK